jgi:membrane protease YdiL (CAAX protease family)
LTEVETLIVGLVCHGQGIGWALLVHLVEEAKNLELYYLSVKPVACNRGYFPLLRLWILDHGRNRNGDGIAILRARYPEIGSREFWSCVQVLRHSERTREKEMYLDILLFIALALGISWAIWLTLGLQSRGTALVMMTPGLLALVLMLTISPLKLTDSPLVRFGPPFYAVVAWVVPVLWIGALTALNLLLRTATFNATFAEPENRREATTRLFFAASFGALTGLIWLWPRLPWGDTLILGFSSWSSATVTLLLLPLIFLPVHLSMRLSFNKITFGQAIREFPRYVVGILLLRVLLPVLGEELAWRGFLLPRLAQANIHLALVGTLVVWWLFHVPVVFLSPQLREAPRWALMASFLGIAGPSFFACWLLLATGSLWPAVIFHLTWNMINPAMLGSIYTGKQGFLRGSIWLINGEGMLGLTVSLSVIAPLFYYLALQA